MRNDGHYLFWSNDSDAFFQATKDLSNTWGFGTFLRVEDPHKGHCIFIVQQPAQYIEPVSIFSDILRNNPNLSLQARVSYGEENHSIFYFHDLYLYSSRLNNIYDEEDTCDDTDNDATAALHVFKDVQPNYQWDFEKDMQELKIKLESMFKKLDKFSIDGDSDCNVFTSKEFAKERITIEADYGKYRMKATKNGYVIESVTITPLPEKQE